MLNHAPKPKMTGKVRLSSKPQISNACSRTHQRPRCAKQSQAKANQGTHLRDARHDAVQNRERHQAERAVRVRQPREQGRVRAAPLAGPGARRAPGNPAEVALVAARGEVRPPDVRGERASDDGCNRARHRLLGAEEGPGGVKRRRERLRACDGGGEDNVVDEGEETRGVWSASDALGSVARKERRTPRKATARYTARTADRTRSRSCHTDSG